MSSEAPRPLTERQRAVMERIDRRASIKVIAQELGVSETRINQHIRALKDIYEAENLADLVDRFRTDQGLEHGVPVPGESDSAREPALASEGGLSEPVYSNSQVPRSGFINESSGQDDPGELVIRDVSPMVDQAPWLVAGEPRVVPRVLDGEHAVWFRLMAIVGIAFAFLAAVVLTMTAAVTISDALDGRATVPVDEQGFS